jgi:ADP-L-glycero-D-manno-heptose 6-epimerase
MILLTGGAGFIGSNILADLNAAGRTDVIVVDRLRDGNKWRNIAKRRFADILFPEEMEPFLERRGDDVTAVIHMGANSSTTARDADDILRTNLRASMRLWEWCTRARRPLVYASSAATYGDGAQGFVDDESESALDRLRPLNLYGWSKHAFDRWAMERARRGEAPPQWVGLKFFNVYGPNEGHKGDMMSLVAKSFGKVAADEIVRLFRSHRPDFADGEQLRDFIYVKDCSAIVLWLLGRPDVHGLFNVGTGTPRSFRALILALAAALAREAKIEYIDMPPQIRAQYQYFTQAPMSKLRNAGYDGAFYSVEDGVRDYVQAYLATSDPYR